MADQNTYTELNWVPDPRTAAERVFFKRTLALTGLQCECLVYDVYLVSAFSGNCTLLTCTTRCRRQTRSLFNSERCTGPCCEPGSAADYTASLLALCCDDQVPSFRVRCTGTCWLRGSSCFGWFIFSRCLWLIPDTLGRAVGCLTIWVGRDEFPRLQRPGDIEEIPSLVQVVVAASNHHFGPMGLH